MTEGAREAGRPFTGLHMLAVVFIFFGTIIAVNILMAVAAVRTFPGLNAHNGYVASQTYNRLLGEAAAQIRRGWQAEIGAEGGRVQFVLHDRTGTPLPLLSVSALAGRPASAAEDRTLSFIPWGEGYESVETLEPGRWIVEIEVREHGALAWRETRHFLATLSTEATVDP